MAGLPLPEIGKGWAGIRASRCRCRNPATVDCEIRERPDVMCSTVTPLQLPKSGDGSLPARERPDVM
ncbi:hypothetical protein ACXIZN_24100 [Amycolatopsis sp. TRM77291]